MYNSNNINLRKVLKGKELVFKYPIKNVMLGQRRSYSVKGDVNYMSNNWVLFKEIQKVNHNISSISALSNRRYFSSSIKQNKYIDKDSAYIFTNIEKILNNNPLNAETQTEIEKFLHNQGIHILEDTKVLGVNINYLNNNVKVYCFDKSELFKIYLNKLIHNLTEKKNIESYINSRSINKKMIIIHLKLSRV